MVNVNLQKIPKFYMSLIGWIGKVESIKPYPIPHSNNNYKIEYSCQGIKDFISQPMDTFLSELEKGDIALYFYLCEVYNSEGEVIGRIPIDETTPFYTGARKKLGKYKDFLVL